MQIIKGKYFLLFFLLFFQNSYSDETRLVSLNNRIYHVSIKDWTSLRDHKVIKQNKDYSCGAASIATLLSYYYQRDTTEQEVLELLIEVADNKGQASFADMKEILPRLGFKGVGLATSWNQLIDLKIPVIAYVRHRKQDHFTVVSGISEGKVKLSDPSLGNRTLTRGQFKEIWETRNEKGLEGKMLAILPLDKEIAKNTDGSFFIKPSASKLTEDLILLKQTIR